MGGLAKDIWERGLVYWLDKQFVLSDWDGSLA